MKPIVDNAFNDFKVLMALEDQKQNLITMYYKTKIAIESYNTLQELSHCLAACCLGTFICNQKDT